MWEAGIRLGSERGSRNNEIIDGEMKIFSVSGNDQFVGKLEVKLREAYLRPADLIPILEKNSQKPFKRVFSLVFCQTVSFPSYFDRSEPFRAKCEELQANVYTLVKVDSNENSKEYKIIPLYNSIDDAKMLCLILPVLFSTLQDFMNLNDQRKMARLIPSEASQEEEFGEFIDIEG